MTRLWRAGLALAAAVAIAAAARVTVSAYGAARTFTLRKGSPQELAEFRAPPTSWRVDSGVDALVHGSREVA